MDEITAPPDRSLAPDELAELSSILRSALRLHNSSCAVQANEDATDLVHYALDLIQDGLSVGEVLEELRCVGLEICDGDSLDEIGERLASYLSGLNGSKHGRTVSEDELADEGRQGGLRRRNSFQSLLLRSENHVAAMDLSAMASVSKKKREMEQLFGSNKKKGSVRVISLKDRMAMYDANGSLKSSFQNPDGGSDAFVDPGAYYFDDINDLFNLTKEEIAERCNDEIEFIIQDVTLTEKDRAMQIKDVRGRYGVLEMKIKVAARAYAAKNKNIKKKKISDGNGIALPATVSYADGELTAVGLDRLDLSAKSVAVKKARELASLKSVSRSVRDRMSMYLSDECICRAVVEDDDGDDISDEDDSEANIGEDDASEDRDDAARMKTNGQLRREALLAIMKIQRSMSKEDKFRMMEEVRRMYPDEQGRDSPKAPASEADPAFASEADEHYQGEDSRMAVQSSLEGGGRRRHCVCSSCGIKFSDLQSIMKDRELSREERRSRLHALRSRHSARRSANIVQEESDDDETVVKTKAAPPYKSTRVAAELTAKSYAELLRDCCEDEDCPIVHIGRVVA